MPNEFSLSAIRWVPVVNTSATPAPPFAVMEICGVTEEGVVEVRRPTTDGIAAQNLLVNGLVSIPADGGAGQAHNSFPAAVLYETADGDAAFGDGYGTAAGSWKLTAGEAGFAAIGGAVGNLANVVPAASAGGGGGTIDVQEADGSPAFAAITTLYVDQATGLRLVSNGGQPELEGVAASTSAMGMVTTGTQTFGGIKNFNTHVGIVGQLELGAVHGDSSDFTLFEHKSDRLEVSWDSGGGSVEMGLDLIFSGGNTATLQVQTTGVGGTKGRYSISDGDGTFNGTDGTLADGTLVHGGIVYTIGSGVGTSGIANDAVTFAKMQNVSTDRLLGRDTAGTGDVEEISLSTGLAFTGSQSIRAVEADASTAGIVSLSDQTMGGGKKTFVSDVISQVSAGNYSSWTSRLEPGEFSSCIYMQYTPVLGSNIEGALALILGGDDIIRVAAINATGVSDKARFAVRSNDTWFEGKDGTGPDGAEYHGGIVTTLSTGLSAKRVTVPASASASGSAGDWAADGSHFYFCSATNTWTRVALATW